LKRAEVTPNEGGRQAKEIPGDSPAGTANRMRQSGSPHLIALHWTTRLPDYRNLRSSANCGMYGFVKTVNFNAVKRQEASNRMAAARNARSSPQAAAALQQRASLVGNGAKWRITNFKQVARAMSQWA